MIIARSRSSISISEPRGGDLAGEIDRDHLHAALFQRGATVGLGVQHVVDDGEPHPGMVEDVVHVRRAEHGIARHPHQAGAVNAEQRFDEFDGIVADRRYLVAGLQPALHQVVREAIGVAFDLGEGNAARAVGQRDPIGKPHRRAFQEIADCDPADAAGAGYAAGCGEVGHGFIPSVVPGREANPEPRDSGLDADASPRNDG